MHDLYPLTSCFTITVKASLSTYSFLIYLNDFLSCTTRRSSSISDAYIFQVQTGMIGTGDDQDGNSFTIHHPFTIYQLTIHKYKAASIAKQ